MQSEDNIKGVLFHLHMKVSIPGVCGIKIKQGYPLKDLKFRGSLRILFLVGQRQKSHCSSQQFHLLDQVLLARFMEGCLPLHIQQGPWGR
uniref:Uncharacterized protein n=1 Tax=Salix viminalis TaxID=40686 RepID=A0A6N2MYP1_SALVM